ncbi:SGNH/GDSL hydrolase family protein [Methylocapsa acidiphila]|uniref:SGNH/GDSL hydrolase family protein n=1 Tax=Methylocapsa acidiphila TaxID=133552 RepID=UPI001FDAA6FB|nr:GDSL-type esterase/lipase family protein [Methylocapsa acidiphila]
MARKIAGGSRTGTALALWGALALISAAGGAEGQQGQGAVPPLSAACDVPTADIAAPASLPNLAAALRERKTARILAIGSSSTAGVGASSNGKSYPSQLETILEDALKGVDFVVLNRGVPGELAQTAAERLKSEVALAAPDLVLWQLGTNDALARIAPSEFEATVLSTIRWLKDNRTDIVLVGPQYSPRFARDPNYFAIRDSLQDIAAKEKILYVRRYDAMQFIAQAHANLQLMARDNFHLNDLGYQCMAEHVAHAVIVSLFIKAPRPVGN